MSQVEWSLRSIPESSADLSTNSAQPNAIPLPAPLSAPSSQPWLHPWPPLIETILQSRGILNKADREKFLYPQLAHLKEPMALLGMAEAVERLTEAFLRQEKVCIYADFDLDGTSGLALLLKGLKALGFQQVIGYQPRRLQSGYGFHKEVVSELKDQGVSLIVTVDVGITALAAGKRAAELGVDVIITDHHQPGEELPEAYVVINPNQKNCKSGLGYLSGAGVAFYLLRALRRGLEPVLSNEAKVWDLKSVLDFFTIATITDMVPLIEDNRVLIKHGLHQLAKTEHVGLRTLLKELGLQGRPLGSQDVGIRFAPKLNALSRMDAEILPIDIMMVEDEVEAEALVKKMMASNLTRIELQVEAAAEAERLLAKSRPKGFVFLASESFHRGVVGLIANKLAQDHQVPAFVGAIDRENQRVVGSARAPEGGISLLDVLGRLPSGMDRFGGHHAAAGFEFKLKHLDFLNSSLEEIFANLAIETRVATIPYDAETSLGALNANFMKWYDFLGPFGSGFELPLLRINRVTLTEMRSLKGNHLKLKFEQIREVDGVQLLSTLETLFFSPPPAQAKALEVGGGFDILIEPQWNYFAGRKTIQGLLRGFKVAEGSKVSQI